MSDKRTFTSTVTYTMTDDLGKVWHKSEHSWKESSQSEAVAVQQLLVNLLGQTLDMGWMVAETVDGEECKQVQALVREVSK